MAAKGKINASKVEVGMRIIVRLLSDGVSVRESGTKTGEGVFVARVIGKVYVSNHSGFRQPGRYHIETTAGTFEAAPIQTMWLAPEDNAGIKRAHVEALAEDKARQAEKVNARETERQRVQEEHEAEKAEALTLHSQDGKVDNMNNDAATQIDLTPRFEIDEAHRIPVAGTENHTGSTVVSLLEKVWARIRADHPELPEVVIITGSGLVGASKWGHFRAKGWKVQNEGSALHKDELFLAGEALAKGAAQVLQTMLHEGAHTLAEIRGQQDTSRQGRWHNAIFRKLAEEMGLEHRGAKANKSHGFSFVTLTTATKEKYADLLAELDREIKLVCHLPVWMGGEADQDGETEGGEKITGKPQGEDGDKPRSGPLKATCLCEEPIIVRLSQKVIDLGVVRCDDCGSLFLARS